MKVRKNIKQVIVLSIITVGLAYVTACQTANTAAKVKEELPASAENIHTKTDVYRAMAEGVTKQCPIKVDGETTLTKLEYNEVRHALAYTYLFSGAVYEDMDTQLWAVVQASTENTLKEKLKTNQSVSQVRADGLTVIYIYKDKNGKELFTVTLLPGEY